MASDAEASVTAPLVLWATIGSALVPAVNVTAPLASNCINPSLVMSALILSAPTAVLSVIAPPAESTP